MTTRPTEDDSTRGLTLRELVLEVRTDLKTQNGRIDRLETKVNRILGGAAVGALLFGALLGRLLA